MAPLAQLQAPGAHVILAAEANFKMHSGATEELGVAVLGTSVMHGRLGAHTGSFSKRSTSDSFRAKRGARVALCREHPTQYLGLTTPSRVWRGGGA